MLRGPEKNRGRRTVVWNWWLGVISNENALITPPIVAVIKKVADNSKNFPQLLANTSFAENPNWYKKCYQSVIKKRGGRAG